MDKCFMQTGREGSVPRKGVSMMNAQTWKTRSSTAVLAGALTIALLLGAGVAHAAVVTQDPAGNATGIRGLEVNGGFWDVEFLWGKGLDIVGLPVDWPNEGNAVAAVNAIAAVLAAEATSVTTVGPVSNMSDYFDVPYQVIGSNAFIVRGNSDGSGGWASGNVGDSIDYSGPFAPDWSYAKFTPADTTPIETTTWGQIKRLFN
jgi:hypothetical protein